MSYLRWPVYIWSDGCATYFWAREGEAAEKAGVRPIEAWCLEEGWAGGLSIEERLLDDFVAVRFAEIIECGRLPAVLRRLKSKKSPFGGNFGGRYILEALGLDPAGEFRALMKQSSLGRQHAWTVRCPTCKAKKGERCTTSGGNLRRSPHAERVDQRERAIKDEIARAQRKDAG